jgi:ABC-type uncharacterized transport system involved in gliding motility auxiliary subunit
MRRSVLALCLLAAAAVAVNAWVAHSTAQVDLSASQRFSLTKETRDVVRAVDKPLRITVFMFERGGVARDARFLLDRYKEINDRIDYRVVDPDEKPAEARRYNVSGYSTVIVEYDGRRSDAPAVSEIQVSSAILRVLRGETKTVCVVRGHGEPALDDESDRGITKLRDLLATNGYDPTPIDLTSGGGVPAACAVVLEIGPTVALNPTEVSALVDYGTRQGRLLVLGDSGLDSDADLNPLLEPFGISISRVIVLDPERAVQSDPFGIVVQSFPSTNPIVRGIPSFELTLATGLLTHSNEAAGLTVSKLAQTSDSGVLDSDTSLSPSAPDIAGPITVAAAADSSRVSGSVIERTRVVAVGNSHWVTNEFIDHLGNRRLLVNSMLWLTEEEQLLTVAASTPLPRELPWTNERQRTVVAVTILGVPGIVVGVGVLQWAIGRRLRPATRAARRTSDRKRRR